MKLYDPSRLSVIFLIPAAMAATSGGWSTTPEPGPLTAEQTVEVVTGNTFQIPDEEMYAFADESGRLPKKLYGEAPIRSNDIFGRRRSKDTMAKFELGIDIERQHG